jgi:hypothetical protein
MLFLVLLIEQQQPLYIISTKVISLALESKNNSGKLTIVFFIDSNKVVIFFLSPSSYYFFRFNCKEEKRHLGKIGKLFAWSFIDPNLEVFDTKVHLMTLIIYRFDCCLKNNQNGKFFNGEPSIF